VAIELIKVPREGGLKKKHNRGDRGARKKKKNKKKVCPAQNGEKGRTI